VSENKKSWSDYFALASDNFKKVNDILHAVVDTVSDSTIGTSFVQLSSKYKSNLAEIRMNVEAANVEYTGMGPILTNLIEIMQDPTANTKPEVQNALRGLASSLIESVRDRIEELSEEHEHQMSLFEHLEKAFHENVLRTTEEVARLQEAVGGLNKRTENLEKSTDHARLYTEKVEKVYDLRSEECASFSSGHATHYVRNEKINSVINQIEEILVNKSHGLVSFFIQREISKRN